MAGLGNRPIPMATEMDATDEPSASRVGGRWAQPCPRASRLVHASATATGWIDHLGESAELNALFGDDSRLNRRPLQTL